MINKLCEVCNITCTTKPRIAKAKNIQKEYMAVSAPYCTRIRNELGYLTCTQGLVVKDSLTEKMLQDIIHNKYYDLNNVSN